MKHVYSFEKLDVWQESKELAKEVYCITKDMPDSEKFGISNQLRRAAISVSSNIAEGSSRLSNKSKSHFYEIAYSSLMELFNQMVISEELKLLIFPLSMRNRVYKISNLLNKLHKRTSSQLNKSTT